MLYKKIQDHGRAIVSTILVASMAVIPVVSAKVANTGEPPAAAITETASAEDEELPLWPQNAEELFILEEGPIDRHLEQLPGIENEQSQERDDKKAELREEYTLFILGSEQETSLDLPKTQLLENLLEEKAGAEAREKEIQAEKSRAAAREKQMKAEKAQAEAKVKEQHEQEAGQVQDNGSQTSENAFLIQISNPDKRYKGQPLKVSDRQALEGLVMGEWGNDYIGAVLVAQCIRDSMLKEGTNSAAAIKKKYGYTAPIKRNVSDTVKKAVAYVFDEGGSGVQHPIYYFYASNLTRGKWHETQKFVVQRKAVRFFSPRR